VAFRRLARIRQAVRTLHPSGPILGLLATSSVAIAADPQLLAASVLGGVVHALFGDRSAFGLVLGGASMLIGGLCTLRVAEPHLAENASRYAREASGAAR